MKIAALIVRGTTNQFEILRQLGMEETQQPLVSRDIATIKGWWKASAIRDFDEAKGKELARLDALEAEAWQAWERSKQPHESTRTRRSTGRTPSDLAELKKEQRDGNPAYLMAILSCVDRRCKLLGLDVGPKGKEPTSTSSATMSDEERAAASRNLLSRLAGYLGTNSIAEADVGIGPPVVEPITVGPVTSPFDSDLP
jgi:hypothetical protein